MVTLWSLPKGEGLEGESEGRYRTGGPQESGRHRWFIQPFLEFGLLAIIEIK